MPFFGAHLSVAGGLENAIHSAVELGCDTVQLFTKNASQWVGKALTDEHVRVFKAATKQAKLKYLTAHDSYLINLAAPGDELFIKSVDAFVDEIERAEKLGLTYLVTHPGAHVGSGDADAILRVISGLDQAMKRTEGFNVKVLLENTAGQGTTLGWKFEHLAKMLEGVQAPERFGVCFDTCHAFAAGYDLTTNEQFQDIFSHFDEVIGLKQLKLFHLNDSVKGLGCRVDRHAGLGLGKIGLEAFRWIVTDPRFQKLPMILETPKENDDGEAMDPVNLAILKGFSQLN
jgi:deoxyribonuclease IV